jgi:PleD family two-component response regulator
VSHAAKAPLPSSYWHLARQLPIYFLRPRSVCTLLREGLNVATILIVEDDREIRALAQALIEEQGHKTLSAATLDEALAILSGSEVVDALFVDIILKGEMQAGIELAKRVVEQA